jgi:hypothetical protein
MDNNTLDLNVLSSINELIDTVNTLESHKEVEEAIKTFLEKAKMKPLRFILSPFVHQYTQGALPADKAIRIIYALVEILND